MSGRVAPPNPRVALKDGLRQWTPLQLERQVASTTRWLEACKVEPGDRVGVYLNRGAELVFALLALGRLGAVYQPLNKRLPPSELRRYLRQTHCRLLVTDSVSLDALDTDVPLVAIDDSIGESACDPAAAAVPPAAPGYLIHTSGSSGQTKPVLVSAESLEIHVEAIIDAYGLDATDYVLQICSPGFDVSIEEIVPTLSAGATLVMAPDPNAVGMQGLCDFIEAELISVVNLPTALWCAWLDHLAGTGRALPSSLRLCIIGGEPCPPHRVDQWRSLSGGVRCLNAYGLTETTITNCYWELGSGGPEAYDRAVPVGKALGSNQLHVLDENLVPVGDGATGELFIGGPWVALGYWGDGALTASRFLPDPFSAAPGARLFRTGDIACLNPQGDVVVTGRSDRQAKLRGYRIELADIELQTCLHPAVSYCHVKLVKQGNDRVLAAFIKVTDDVACEPGVFLNRACPGFAAELSGWLRGQVAEYAVPAVYMFFRELPLTANGKVDLAAFPDSRLPAATPEPAEGDNPVLACFREVLGFEPDLASGFYDLGGDSVMALRLVSRLRRAGFDLPLSALMSGGNFADLLSQVTPLAAEVSSSEVARRSFVTGVSLTRTELSQLYANQSAWSETEFICAATAMQMQMLDLSMRYPGSGNCVEQVEGRIENLQVHDFKAAWEAVCARHESLRSYFNLRFPGKPLQVCRKSPQVSWQEHDWSHLSMAQQKLRLAEYLRADRHRDFPLIDKPLLRWHLIRLDAHAYHFIWSYHHALLDGWSDVMVLQDVFAHYRCAAPAGRPAGSYRDYVSWLALQDHEGSSQYWRKCLEPLDEHRPWLLASPQPVATRPGLGSGSGIGKIKKRLGAAASETLRREARRLELPVSTLFTAAFGLSLATARGEHLVVFGQFIWVRPTALMDLDATAGMFVNLVPVILQINDSERVVDFLKALLAQQLAREPHTYLPSSRMTPAIRAADDRPLLDASIVFENYPDVSEPQVASLRSHAQSTIPITCYVWPGDDVLLEVGFDRALVPEETAERILGDCAAYVSALAGSSEIRALREAVNSNRRTAADAEPEAR